MASNRIGRINEEIQRELAELIEESGFAPTVRGETLDIPSFASLANAIAERKG